MLTVLKAFLSTNWLVLALLGVGIWWWNDYTDSLKKLGALEQSVQQLTLTVEQQEKDNQVLRGTLNIKSQVSAQAKEKDRELTKTASQAKQQASEGQEVQDWDKVPLPARVTHGLRMLNKAIPSSGSGKN